MNSIVTFNLTKLLIIRRQRGLLISLEHKKWKSKPNSMNVCENFFLKYDSIKKSIWFEQKNLRQLLFIYWFSITLQFRRKSVGMIPTEKNQIDKRFKFNSDFLIITSRMWLCLIFKNSAFRYTYCWIELFIYRKWEVLGSCISNRFSWPSYSCDDDVLTE